MREILVVYNEIIFLEFIEKYLALKGYHVLSAVNGLEGIRIAKKELPDLLILDKRMRGIELEGFLIKKTLIPELRELPLFLIGDFTSKELREYKDENIKAFISVPINPESLLERLNLFFNIPLQQESSNTPMLVDMHSKGNILIIQIEGNFETDKLEILNYEIRAFCIKKMIKKPKIFLIIPSLYQESITDENLEILFNFLTYPELNLSCQDIKILSQCAPFLDKLGEKKKFSDFEFVVNFIDGIQKLNLDFDNKKDVSVEHLKEGASYIFDLYDETGMVRIPALTQVSKDMIDYLLHVGQKKLTYFSESQIEEADKKHVVSAKTAQQNLESIIYEHQEIDEDFDIIKQLRSKMDLFLRKLKGSNMLIISKNKAENDILLKVLSPYMRVDFSEGDLEVSDLEKNRYILIFIDMQGFNAVELLKIIRSKFSKKETTVIVTSNHVSIDTLDNLKKNGTDNILLSPFTSSEVQKKVFQSVSSDREFSAI